MTADLFYSISYVCNVLINYCLLADFVVEVCNALVGPVFPQRGQDMAQCVRPSDEHKSDI